MFIGALYHPPRRIYKSSELLSHLQDCINAVPKRVHGCICHVGQWFQFAG